MRSDFLPFSPPLIGEEEIAQVVDTLRSGWLTTGPKVSLFERRFADYVSAGHALALSSGTAAMHSALLALGVGPGDEVISTPMTFASSIHVIEHVGARPVLVDVDEETLNISPKKAAEAVTSKTRALLPVHLYGQPCDMASLVETARKNRLAIVEDAAHALPAEVCGRKVGAPVDPTGEVKSLTAFSFYATKNLTTAEGGMLTGPSDLLEKARMWSIHGISRDAYQRYAAGGSWFYEVVAPGFKYNMTDIQAALGLAQLDRLGAMQQRRRELVEAYWRGLSDVPELQLPKPTQDSRHAWHIFAIRLHLDLIKISRGEFIERLRNLNIGTSVHFIPVHLHPYYRDRYGFRPEDFPVASREFERLVSLPLNPRMSDQDLEDVVEAVRKVISETRR